MVALPSISALVFLVTAQGATQSATDLRATDMRASDMRALDRGLSLLKNLEAEEALGELEKAAADGGYSYDDVVRLYEALGTARAYAGDEAGASWAFERLLAASPGYVLPYTTSPKATFAFQKAIVASRARRAREVRVEARALPRFGMPVELLVTNAADPFAGLRVVQVHSRLKGDDEERVARLAPPPVGHSVSLELSPVPESAGAVDEAGGKGAIVEVQVHGYDDKGWEIYRGDFVEIPVGFGAPGPFYGEPWFWISTVAGALALSSAAAVIVLWPPPDEVPVRFEVTP